MSVTLFALTKEQQSACSFFFMEKLALSFLQVRLLSKKTRATVLHVETFPDYFELVFYSIITYATDNIIVHALKKMNSSKRAPETSVVL